MVKDQTKIIKIDGRAAVFIDAANLEKSVADLGTQPQRINYRAEALLPKQT